MERGNKMPNRSPIEALKGYFYQFDHSIERILMLKEATDSIVIEGIEDIDIKSATEETAVQCKYYSKTEYNHSVIAKPIRLMLSHYKKVKEGKKKRVKYVIYGSFKSGKEKLNLPIDCNFLKDKFLTYTKNKKKYYHHLQLGLNDADLNDFLSLLKINLDALDYESQLTNIFLLLKKQFNCSDFEAEHFYYNSALKVIKDLATQDNVEERRITKKQFLSTTYTVIFPTFLQSIIVKS
jgi:hypothetical protein